MTKEKNNFNSVVFTEELKKCYTILQQQEVIIKFMKTLMEFKDTIIELINNGTISGIEITEDVESGDIIIKTKQIGGINGWN